MALEPEGFSLRTLENIEGGDHLCCFLSTETERRSVLGDYLARGLRLGQKVLYLHGSGTIDPVLDAIISSGFDPTALQSAGQMVVAPASDFLAPGGVLDPSAALARLQAFIAPSGDVGSPIVRLLIEPDGLLPIASSTTLLLDFEAGLEQIISHRQILALCQYDPQRFAAIFLDEILACHPLVSADGEVFQNPCFYPQGAETLPDGLRLSLPRLAHSLLLAQRRARELSERELTLDKKEMALAQERNLLRTVIDNLPDRIYVKDADCRKILANLADAQAMGAASPEEVVGKMDADFYPPDLAARYYADDQSVIRSGHPLVNREEPAPDSAGNSHWILTTKVPLRDSQGKVIGLVGIGHDITERMKAQEKLQYVSTHDTLTSLYNRAFFEEELSRLERGRHYPVTIIVADVDGMKATNDKMGHPMGDELLRRIAQALRSAFRADDVIARIGGDEFAILLPDTDAVAADAAVLRIRSNLLVHNRRSQGLLLSLSVGASTGLKGRSLQEVMHEADRRMYEDKQRRAAS
jgi:diguanylate cyclase (GGDEF)-like protein/PAS domain S-box-containing protein